MKIAQTLEDSNIFPKEVTKAIKKETKEQKGGFLSMLLLTLGGSLLGNLLTGKGIVIADTGRPLSSAFQIKKKKELQELAQEKNGVFNATSSFIKF